MERAAMRKWRKSYKTEINPTQEQIQKINKTIGDDEFGNKDTDFSGRNRKKNC